MTSAVWDTTTSLPSNPTLDISAFSVFAEGLDHPEGVACGPDGTLFAGGEAGQIYRVGLDGSVEEIANTGGFILGLCLDASGAIYACDSAAQCLKKIAPDGVISVYSSGAPERPMVTPNYPVFDAAGNLYVSDSGEWKAHNGCIFRIDPGGVTDIFTADVASFPNGMALHPEGHHLYAVESQSCSIVSIEIRDDGSAGEIETIVEIPNNVPDGLAFDEDGTLFISCYSPDVIYRLSAGRELSVLAADWERVVLAAPTNLAFCGPDRTSLVVGSLGRWHLANTDMVVPGARLRFPDLSKE